MRARVAEKIAGHGAAARWLSLALLLGAASGCTPGDDGSPDRQPAAEAGPAAAAR